MSNVSSLHPSNSHITQPSQAAIDETIKTVKNTVVAKIEQSNESKKDQNDVANKASQDAERANKENNQQHQPDKVTISKESRDKQLEEQKLNEIRKLSKRSQEVRNHESAHKSVGSKYAGAMTLDYTYGPDGRKYAIGGEVEIDVSPIPNNPEATMRKMEVVMQAAMAPAEPSSQDRAVARLAQRILSEAQSELITKSSEKSEKESAMKTETSKDDIEMKNRSNDKKQVDEPIKPKESNELERSENSFAKNESEIREDIDQMVSARDAKYNQKEADLGRQIDIAI